jgi:hypothetical protein
MTPAKYDFPDQTAGDTVANRRFTVTRTVGGVTSPENLTGVAIACWFARGEGGGPVVLKLAIGSGLTVVNAAGGIFDLGGFSVPREPGPYRYDIQFTYPDGRVRTYVAGRMRVLADVST